MANRLYVDYNIMKEVGAKVAQFMGYSYLKPEQERIINRILSKRDVFEIHSNVVSWRRQVPTGS